MPEPISMPDDPQHVPLTGEAVASTGTDTGAAANRSVDTSANAPANAPASEDTHPPARETAPRPARPEPAYVRRAKDGRLDQGPGATMPVITAGQLPVDEGPIGVRWPWYLLAAIVVGLDQWSKRAILQRFREGERLNIVPDWFDLTLWYNPGAAFSFLSNHDGWQRWLFAGIAIVASIFICWMLQTHRHGARLSFALSMVLGGAIGNLIDRFVHGKVVDFLLFHHGGWSFPAFNLADSAITLGAILLILDELLHLRADRHQPPQPARHDVPRDPP